MDDFRKYTFLEMLKDHLEYKIMIQTDPYEISKTYIDLKKIKCKIEEMDIEFEKEARLNKIVDKLCEVKDGGE